MTLQTLEEKASISECEWANEESVRRLMSNPPSNLMRFAWVAVALYAGLHYGYSNTLQLGIWFIFTVLMVPLRFKFKTDYAKYLALNDPAGQQKEYNRYRFAVNLNAVAWGIGGWFAFSNVLQQNLILSTSVFIFNMILLMQTITFVPKVANQFIDILMGTFLIGIAWVIHIAPDAGSQSINTYFLFGMVAAWLILKNIARRNYQAIRLNIMMEYRNNKLISNLSQQTVQLAAEKKAALDANATIKRFYSSAAHDIRQPVYALNMYSALLQDAPENSKTLLPKITASCRAINALFESLFDYEKIDAGQLTITVAKIDLSVLFTELKATFTPLGIAKNLDIRFRKVTGHLMVDYALIHTVLSHLIANAIKYTPSGGVLIAARHSGNGIRFEVWDTGIGIDPSQHTAIFEEFYKVGEHSSADEGFGLGLSIVKRLTAHIDGASVSVQSRVGRGSVFKLTIPNMNHSPQALDEKAISSSP
jgi:signal transduction histidine kinase